MCGIIGFFNRKNGKNSHWNLNTVFDTLLHWRRKGVDGMGMLIITDTKYIAMKDKVTQSEFIVKYGKSIADYMADPETRAIIFHNRWATHGGKTADGCHPFVGERYILMHNGSVDPKSIATVDDWDYTCNSDTEKMAALLNSQENRLVRPEELLEKIGSDLYKKDSALGVLVVYDIEEDMLYILRSNDREFCYNLEGKHITRFWNDFIYATRFSDKREVLPHGSLLKIDPNTGEVVKEWMKVLPPVPPVKKVVTASAVGTTNTVQVIPTKANPIAIGPTPNRMTAEEMNKQIEAQRDRINGGGNKGYRHTKAPTTNALTDPFMVDDNPTPEQLNAMLSK